MEEHDVISHFTLDGGGCWALIQAMALNSLYPGESGHQILNRFDLAIANSGGSIVLAGLVKALSKERGLRRLVWSPTVQS